MLTYRSDRVRLHHISCLIPIYNHTDKRTLRFPFSTLGLHRNSSELEGEVPQDAFIDKRGETKGGAAFLALGVIVRLFANGNDAVTDTKLFAVVLKLVRGVRDGNTHKGGGVEVAPVVPDCDVTASRIELRRPAEADLEVVVLADEFEEVPEDQV